MHWSGEAETLTGAPWLSRNGACVYVQKDGDTERECVF